MQDYYTGLLSGTHCLQGMTDTGKHMVTNKGFLGGELKKGVKHWHRGGHSRSGEEEHPQACGEDDTVPTTAALRRARQGTESRAHRKARSSMSGFGLGAVLLGFAIRPSVSFPDLSRGDPKF